jgi:hypothetical protein
MPAFAVQPSSPLAADGPALIRVLHRAGLARASAIHVTGPAGVPAALWLTCHGFNRVAYIHANWVASAKPVDALVIPHACPASELARVLQGADCVRAGGVLIVQTPPNASAQGAESVGSVLEPLGYQVEHRLSDRGKDVCIARRRGFDLKKAA